MVSNKNVERKQIMRVNLRTAEDVKQGRMKTSCSSTTDNRRKSLSLKIEERTPKKERDNTRSEEGGKDEEEEEEEGEKKNGRQEDEYVGRVAETASSSSLS